MLASAKLLAERSIDFFPTTIRLCITESETEGWQPVEQGRGIGFPPVISRRTPDRLEAYPTLFNRLSGERKSMNSRRVNMENGVFFQKKGQHPQEGANFVRCSRIHTVAVMAVIDGDPLRTEIISQVVRIMRHAQRMSECKQSDTRSFADMAKLFVAHPLRSAIRQYLTGLFSVIRAAGDRNRVSPGLLGSESPSPLRT